MKMKKLLINHRINFIFCGMLNFLLLSSPLISLADERGRIYIEPSELPSAVPSSINSIKNDFKTSAEITKNIGEGVSSVGKILNSDSSGGAKYFGGGIQATGSVLSLVYDGDKCLKTHELDSCADGLKDMAGATKGMAEGVEGLGTIKAVPAVGQIYNTVNVGSSIVKGVDAYYRGDDAGVLNHSFDVVEKSFDIGLSATLPPAGLAKGLMDSACNIASGKSCANLAVEEQVKVAKEYYDSTGCVKVVSWDEGFIQCDERKVEQIDNEKRLNRLANYSEYQKENGVLQNQQRTQANRSDSIASDDNGFVELLGIVGASLDAYQTQASQHKNNKNSQSGSSSSCQNKPYNTPDGCHPGHDEARHPGGCYCG